MYQHTYIIYVCIPTGNVIAVASGTTFVFRGDTENEIPFLFTSRVSKYSYVGDIKLKLYMDLFSLIFRVILMFFLKVVVVIAGKKKVVFVKSLFRQLRLLFMMIRKFRGTVQKELVKVRQFMIKNSD